MRHPRRSLVGARAEVLGALGAAAVLAYVVALLTADRFVGRPGQVVLGCLTWIALLVAGTRLTPALRLQTALVVVVATATEVIASVLWGVYTYRLENLPAFVPPGHGLVYLGGVALGAAFARRERALVSAALAALAVWGVAGLTILPRLDVGGAVGCALLGAVLLRTRAPAYAGVFVIVAALELYGTAIGTWTWAAEVPGLRIPNGNPPSGVASGYVLFDVIAVAGAVWIAGAVRHVNRRPPARLVPASETADA